MATVEIIFKIDWDVRIAAIQKEAARYGYRRITKRIWRNIEKRIGNIGIKTIVQD